MYDLIIIIWDIKYNVGYNVQRPRIYVGHVVLNVQRCTRPIMSLGRAEPTL